MNFGNRKQRNLYNLCNIYTTVPLQTNSRENTMISTLHCDTLLSFIPTSHLMPPLWPGLAYLTGTFFFYNKYLSRDDNYRRRFYLEGTSEVQLARGISAGVHTRALCCRCLKVCSMLTCTISVSIFFALSDCSSPLI